MATYLPQDQECEQRHVLLYDPKYAVPAATKLYGQRAVWQDEPATIHCTEAALEACSAFTSRIPHEEQAEEMADIWHVENIWSIVKEMMKSKPS